MTSNHDLASSRTFLAVVRTGSFSAAARALGQAPPTVRRQIEQLERNVGAALFSRSPDGVRATPLASLLVPMAERVETAAQTFARAVERERFAGTVRIAADPLVATRVLPTILAAPTGTHPDLRFEVVVARGGSEAVRRTAELSLSFRRPTSEGLVASRLATLHAGMFASEAWLERHGSAVGFEHLIGDPDDAPAVDALSAGGASPTSDRFVLATGDGEAAFAAVLQGVGVGLLPIRLANAVPDLVRVLPDISSTTDLWLSIHPDLRRAPQVRATIDAIRHGLERVA